MIKPHPKPPNIKRLPVSKRMTIAVGMFCNSGVVFGADTEEQIGDMTRRVHKIPTLYPPYPRAMITGSCLNGHLMDTAVERIFDGLKQGGAKDEGSIMDLLDRTMVGLYRREFKAYPDQGSIAMRLLVAVKPDHESKVYAWSIDSSVVRRMTSPHEIVGVGELVQYIADHLNQGTESLANVIVEMVQVLSAAKDRVLGVGGDSYVHWICDDGSMGQKNFSFSPDTEELYEYFLTHGRSLLIATGTEEITDEQLDKLGEEFVADLKWKRARMFGKR
ncbi:MAG: hypothetical protein LAO03_07995 [Acidobacteriia bacterium]|nr:hypothetical protein [Terriglobia bacterium]